MKIYYRRKFPDLLYVAETHGDIHIPFLHIPVVLIIKMVDIQDSLSREPRAALLATEQDLFRGLYLQNPEHHFCPEVG